MIAHPTGEFLNEKYRPQFHFTPARNWMNDPNGLVFYKGLYHLFFQHNPLGNSWGNMSWGHAVSRDLYTWREMPVAIACTEKSGIFSGSAVVDYNNTTGFGSLENPPIVAIYTEHQNDESNQSQCLAYSIDEGSTFIKYENNPVLDLQLPNFRDPKVDWINGKWVMTVALPQEHKISFYSSPDLKSWNHLSDFGPAAEVGGVWECPDLIRIGSKWVLIVSLNPGGFQIGSGTQYFIGQWNGNEFIPDDTETRWLDFGRDNYAGVTFANTELDRRVFIGWMSNWAYASQVPTYPWRSAMTLPRELTLQGNALVQTPMEHPEGFTQVEFKTSQGFVTIFENPEHYVRVGVRNNKVFVDTSKAWADLDAPVVQEIPCDFAEIDFRVIVDRGSIEVFAAGGSLVVTNLIFVESTLTYVKATDVRELKLQRLSLGRQD